jgi:putative peptide zinc metalloprotease protein
MSKEDVTPEIMIDTPAPDFELESVQGPVIRLADYHDKSHVLLWFSRGFTCPFCRRYMAQLNQALDQFQSADTQIVQIAPNLLDRARMYFKRQPLGFPFLCDSSSETFYRFGLLNLGPIEATKNGIYSFAYAYTHGDGINTTRASFLDTFSSSIVGRFKHHATEALQQGVFVIDRQGIVRYAKALGPVETIPPIEELLREVQKLS